MVLFKLDEGLVMILIEEIVPLMRKISSQLQEAVSFACERLGNVGIVRVMHREVCQKKWGHGMYYY